MQRQNTYYINLQRATDMRDRDSQTGEYDETYPLQKFIDALEELDGEVGTKAVEHAVGCEYRTALAKLKELEDRDVLTTSRVGNAYLWSLAQSTENEPPQVEEESSNEESPTEEDDGPIDG
jgi:hypothetical protein